MSLVMGGTLGCVVLEVVLLGAEVVVDVDVCVVWFISGSDGDDFGLLVVDDGGLLEVVVDLLLLVDVVPSFPLLLLLLLLLLLFCAIAGGANTATRPSRIDGGRMTCNSLARRRISNTRCNNGNNGYKVGGPVGYW